MSLVRLYIDEDAMSRALVQALRARGIDVATSFEAGLNGKPDVVQLGYACEHDRVLYTFNVGDFCRLHAEFLAQGRSHPGIVVVYDQRYSVGEQIRRLARLVQSRSADEMRNMLLYL